MLYEVITLPGNQAQSAYVYADKALYRAKDAGKNCACRYDVETSRYMFLCNDSRSKKQTVS